MIVVVLILPLNFVNGQSSGQEAALSLLLQNPSPQREGGKSPGVPVAAGWRPMGNPQEARMNTQLNARIHKRLIFILYVQTMESATEGKRLDSYLRNN